MRLFLPFALFFAGVSTSRAQSPGLTYNFSDPMLAQAPSAAGHVVASTTQPLTVTIVIQPPPAVNPAPYPRSDDAYEPQYDADTGSDQGNTMPRATADNQPQAALSGPYTPQPIPNPNQPAVNDANMASSGSYAPQPYVPYPPQLDPNTVPQQPYVPYWTGAPGAPPQILGDSPVAAQPDYQASSGQPLSPGYRPQPVNGQPQPANGQPQPVVLPPGPQPAPAAPIATPIPTQPTAQPSTPPPSSPPPSQPPSAAPTTPQSPPTATPATNHPVVA